VKQSDPQQLKEGLRDFIFHISKSDEKSPDYEIAGATFENWMTITFLFFKDLIGDINTMVEKDHKVNSQYIHDLRVFYMTNLVDIKTALDPNLIKAGVNRLKARYDLPEQMHEETIAGIWRKLAPKIPGAITKTAAVVTGIVSILTALNALFKFSAFLSQHSERTKSAKKMILTEKYLTDFYFDSFRLFLIDTFDAVIHRSIQDPMKLKHRYYDYVSSTLVSYPKIGPYLKEWAQSIPMQITK